MMTHSVFFWLKPGTSDSDRSTFKSELEKLLQIEHVDQGYAGSPAGTAKRAAVDHSFDYSITLLFKSLEAHDVYQSCPAHDEFVDKCSSLWESVKVYDTELL